ncbi:hypothetical protein Q4557_05160 [Shewanella sp. 5_MG-2023]|uniref:hypothetical protein n=1 Tax=Shewanella sp. 5_MG-2023 TaxID=3062656 RepID=UPI0026E2CEE1|nr:hypothetical protein [Shewanella sp. 5_MG-2023]MDO6639348.1 hypothetical protein [Shewanella sp. 5_MG-2023]
MSLKEKNLDLVNEVKNTAEQLTHNLQQSQTFEQAKSSLSNTKERALAVDPASIKLMNFFAVFSLAFMLLSTYFPVMKVMGSSIPLSEMTPVWLFIVAILALCSHLFGVKQSISRGLLLLLLLSISYTVYQQIADMFQAAKMFGGVSTKDIMRGVAEGLKYAGVGFYLFLASLVLVVIATIKPGYKTNHALWAQLIQK